MVAEERETGLRHAPSRPHANALPMPMITPPIRLHLKSIRYCWGSWVRECEGACVFFSLEESSFRSFLTLRWTDTTSEHKKQE